jgi:hypothetical protein
MEECESTSAALIMLKRGGAVAALCSIAIGLSAELTAEASTAVAQNQEEYHQAQADYAVALQHIDVGRTMVQPDLLHAAIQPVTGDSPAIIPEVIAHGPLSPIFNLQNLQPAEPIAPSAAAGAVAPKFPSFDLSKGEATPAPQTTAPSVPKLPRLGTLPANEVPTTEVAAPVKIPPAPSPAPAPAAETLPALPQAETQTLARKILQSPNVSFQTPEERTWFQHIAETGHGVNCEAPAISAKLLGIIDVLTSSDKYDYALVIGVLDDGHDCDGLEHPKGNAVDINGINHRDRSPGGTGNHINGDVGDFDKPLVKSFYKDVGELLAANGGGALAQHEWFKDPNNELKVGGVFYYQSDNKYHMHMDVGVSFAARAEPIKNPEPAPAPPTPPPAVPEIPTTAAATPRKLPPFSLAPKADNNGGPEPDPKPKAKLPSFSLPTQEAPNQESPQTPATTTPEVKPAPKNSAPSSPTTPEVKSAPKTSAPSSPTTPEVATPPSPAPAPTTPEAPASPKHVSIEKVLAMLPGADPQVVRDVYPKLITALAESGIDDYQMERFSFATIAVETGSCLPIKEKGGEAYLRSKDYFPYFGRGYIQLTWKGTYQKAGDALGLDLVNNPDLALVPENAIRIFAWFLSTDGRNERIRANLDKGNLEGARAVVNGRRDDGHPNGMPEFTRSWEAGAQ